MIAQIHRFRDSAALSAGNGQTVYMVADSARRLAAGLIAIADSIDCQRFSESAGLTREEGVAIEPTNERPRDQDGRAYPQWASATYSGQFQPIAGKWLVCAYRADFRLSPIIYKPAESWSHRTLGAAARRLARMIAQIGKERRVCDRFDSAYILAPDGRRLALRSAQAELKESRNGIA